MSKNSRNRNSHFFHHNRLKTKVESGSGKSEYDKIKEIALMMERNERVKADGEVVVLSPVSRGLLETEAKRLRNKMGKFLKVSKPSIHDQIEINNERLKKHEQDKDIVKETIRLATDKMKKVGNPDNEKQKLSILNRIKKLFKKIF